MVLVDELEEKPTRRSGFCWETGYEYRRLQG
jgi:hypothetical protein